MVKAQASAGSDRVAVDFGRQMVRDRAVRPNSRADYGRWRARDERHRKGEHSARPQTPEALLERGLEIWNVFKDLEREDVVEGLVPERQMREVLVANSPPVQRSGRDIVAK